MRGAGRGMRFSTLPFPGSRGRGICAGLVPAGVAVTRVLLSRFDISKRKPSTRIPCNVDDKSMVHPRSDHVINCRAYLVYPYMVRPHRHFDRVFVEMKSA